MWAVTNTRFPFPYAFFTSRPARRHLDVSVGKANQKAWRVAVVERERRVAGEVFFKNGHMDFDCRRTESMVAIWSGGLSLRLRLSVFSCFFCQQKMVIEWC